MRVKKTNDNKQGYKRQIQYLLVGVAVLTLLWVVFRPMGILDTWKLGQMLANVEEENGKLRDEIARLKADVTDLRTNKTRIEFEARKIWLVKPDEMAIFIDNGTGGKSVDPH